MKPRGLTVFIDAQRAAPGEIKTNRREMSRGRAGRRQSCTDGRDLSLVLRRKSRRPGVIELPGAKWLFLPLRT